MTMACICVCACFGSPPKAYPSFVSVISLLVDEGMRHFVGCKAFSERGK